MCKNKVSKYIGGNTCRLSYLSVSHAGSIPDQLNITGWLPQLCGTYYSQSYLADKRSSSIHMNISPHKRRGYAELKNLSDNLAFPLKLQYLKVPPQGEVTMSNLFPSYKSML